ncbi:hypothetical protein [Actinomadura parmotrematis]|uniref:Uncharacterized protein n=1 Tax=Actinomadura parmotrematis TaxID=2864039 RepID=A0ABS7FP10_9ACTN|nr:hypothetical protein [Actinomadura parmotrematis]MBW8481313.1 hypothetical protein [Actinomadura parmotrematis]
MTRAASPSAPAGATATRKAKGSAAGTWRGPANEDGSRPTLVIRASGAVALKSGGFTCTGTAAPQGRGYLITFTACPAPIPKIKAVPGASGRTLVTVTSGQTDTWRRVGG